MLAQRAMADVSRNHKARRFATSRLVIVPCKGLGADICRRPAPDRSAGLGLAAPSGARPGRYERQLSTGLSFPRVSVLALRFHQGAQQSFLGHVVHDRHVRYDAGQQGHVVLFRLVDLDLTLEALDRDSRS